MRLVQWSKKESKCFYVELANKDKLFMSLQWSWLWLLKTKNTKKHVLHISSYYGKRSGESCLLAQTQPLIVNRKTLITFINESPKCNASFQCNIHLLPHCNISTLPTCSFTLTPMSPRLTFRKNDGWQYFHTPRLGRCQLIVMSISCNKMKKVFCQQSIHWGWFLTTWWQKHLCFNQLLITRASWEGFSMFSIAGRVKVWHWIHFGLTVAYHHKTLQTNMKYQQENSL